MVHFNTLMLEQNGCNLRDNIFISKCITLKETHYILVAISQSMLSVFLRVQLTINHLFMKWLCAISHQAITWINVDIDPTGQAMQCLLYEFWDCYGPEHCNWYTKHYQSFYKSSCNLSKTGLSWSDLLSHISLSWSNLHRIHIDHTPSVSDNGPDLLLYIVSLIRPIEVSLIVA